VNPHRRRSHRGPGLRGVGDERPGALVDEDHHRPLLAGSFFQAGPRGSRPARHLGPVLLPGLAGGSLPGEPVPLEQHPRTTLGGADTPLLLEPVHDPSPCPQVGLGSEGRGPSRQDLGERGPRLPLYERGAPSSRLGSKGVRAVRLERLPPLVDRLRGRGETARDLGGSNALTKEPETFPAAFLEDKRITGLLSPASQARRKRGPRLSRYLLYGQ